MDNTQEAYAEWVAVYDWEAFITVALPWNIPAAQAFPRFVNEILRPICRSSPRNDITCMAVVSPGHPGLQQRHIHAAVATKKRDILPRLPDLLGEDGALFPPMGKRQGKLYSHLAAVDIIPFRRYQDTDPMGEPRKPHTVYFAEHLTGTEDLIVYGKRFLDSIKLTGA